jgi:hypothetical protein
MQFGVSFAGCIMYTDEEFDGVWSVTRTGLVCQAWTVQTPHIHNYDTLTLFPDATWDEADNNCRYLGEPAPWCYTTDPHLSWDYCHVPHCEPEREFEIVIDTIERVVLLTVL